MKLQGTMQVNQKNHLEIGGCDTVELAREFGTPLYVIDETLFRQNCRAYYQAFTESYGATVIYASKTLSNLAVCSMVEQEGLGLDVVSGGELYTAAKARFPMERVYFHGNNKSPEELRMALEYKVGRIVVDNRYELETLNNLAGEMGVKVNILLRLSPGVEAHTHEYIKTGQIDSKFGLVIENGMAMAGVKRALQLPHVQLTGFHCHIGSQIFELQSYAHAAEVMMGFVHNVYRETGFVAEELNMGGGLGIYYYQGDRPRPVKEYADVLMTAVKNTAAALDLPVPKVIVEPGRSIAGPAGITLYTVGAIKDIPGIRKYVAVDGGMGDNPRPALYQSKYEACVANRMHEQPVEKVSIAGKCCESGDMLIRDIALPSLQPGDILAVLGTGAYNYSMSMNYNRLPRPAMILVNNGRADLIVRREDYCDLIRNDVMPDRLRSNLVKLASSR
ncbi:diaminopimelate decarboxylase [Desulforamulus hydrothermalis]|uniref:Diaminopimelate decarboxylase n=1 Tax=Desulforamulus hydrothermalis Lam5 = DSM 18033 TaxID=1121428 RepID=K8EBG8_9FIRM|nr:diaminopimelate decarboxylase [Desulforamulus hydrothermalis]CCO08993.1 Diaminopimelate decarboxylase [Desulforamulus hydrothermalis Lam5 = DSM 18033]SHG76441.1 diaminopimelate decarboxylase [Desulforamulus hydrothermalis Lam5 = DSM 18033]